MDFFVKGEVPPFEHKAMTACCGRAPLASARRHCTTPPAGVLAQ